MRKCDYCYQMGHKRSDCPKLTEDIESKRDEDKVQNHLCFCLDSSLLTTCVML